MIEIIVAIAIVIALCGLAASLGVSIYKLGICKGRLEELNETEQILYRAKLLIKESRMHGYRRGYEDAVRKMKERGLWTET